MQVDGPRWNGRRFLNDDCCGAVAPLFGETVGAEVALVALTVAPYLRRPQIAAIAFRMKGDAFDVFGKASPGLEARQVEFLGHSDALRRIEHAE